jgi:autotransporter-associated beta strand protein
LTLFAALALACALWPGPARSQEIDIQTGTTLSTSTDAGIGPAGGWLEFHGGTLESTGSFSTSRVADIREPSTILTDAGTVLTWNGYIQGGGGFTKAGAGTLVLNSANPFSGGLSVTGGTLTLGVQNALASVSYAAIYSGATLDMSAANANQTFNCVILGSGAVLLGANTLTVADHSIATTLITFSGAGGLTLDVTELTLGAKQAYTGATTLGSGDMIILPVQDAIASSSGVTMSAGATLDMSAANANQTLQGLSGTGTVSLGANSLTVTGGGNFAGVIADGGSNGGTGGSLTVGGGVLTLSGANTYTGGTTVTGGGTLAISAANNLPSTGALTLNNGTLEATSGISLSQNVILGSSGGTIQADAGTLTLSGNISGSGGLTKTGAGTLALAGTNTYTGGTAINAGTLSVADWSTLGGANNALTFGGGTLLVGGVNVLQSGLSIPSSGLTFDTTTGDQTVSGVLSGSGSLTKAGAGTLYLTGTNTYAGSTYFNAGTINIVSDANLGDPSGPLIFNGGGLQLGASVISARSVTLNSGGGTFDTNGNNLTLNGTISGVGSLSKIGTGTLNLTGANTYTGGTNINDGTVNIVSDANLGDPSGAVAFNGGRLQAGGPLTTSRTFTVNPGGGILDNNGNPVTLAGTLTGSGPFTFTGQGVTTISGNGSAYSGQASLTGGILFTSPSGSLGGTLTVNQGAAIGGYGTLGNVVNNGLVAPGDAIGTLTVAGNYTQGATASYYDEISPNGPGDLLAVAGSATLNGSLLYIQAPQVYYPTGAMWPVITAANGLTGTFAPVIQNNSSPTLVFVPVYTGNTVSVMATRIPYATYALDGRSAAVGAGLNAAAYNAQGGMQSLLTTLDFSPSAVTSATLGQLSPESYDAVTQSVLDAGRVLTAAQRTGLRGDASGSAAFAGLSDTGPATLLALNNIQNSLSDLPTQFGASGPDSGAQPFTDPRFGVFLRPFGVLASQAAGSERTGYSSSTGGLTGGLTFRPNPGLTLGLAPGYFTQSVKMKTLGGANGTVSDFSLALMGSYRRGDWFVEGLVRGGYDVMNANRTIAIPSTTLAAKANWTGWNATAAVDSGYDFHLGETTLGPVASVEWQNLRQNPYSESRAGALGLSINGRSDQSLTTTLGGRIFRKFETKIGAVTPEARLAWEGQWIGAPRSIFASFDGNSQSGFTTKTAFHNYNAALVDAGVSVAMSQSLCATVRVGVELFRPGYTSQAASLGIKYSF